MARVHVVGSALALVALLATSALAQTAGPAQSSVSSAPPAAAQAPAGGNDADELSRQATDPTASLMAFNLINYFRTSFYDLDDSGFEFRFQPVVPFRAWKTSNILRVVVPYQADGPGDEGLKDVTIFDLVVLPQKWGRFAIGPVMSLSKSASEPGCQGKGLKKGCIFWVYGAKVLWVSSYYQGP